MALTYVWLDAYRRSQNIIAAASAHGIIQVQLLFDAGLRLCAEKKTVQSGSHAPCCAATASTETKFGERQGFVVSVGLAALPNTRPAAGALRERRTGSSHHPNKSNCLDHHLDCRLPPVSRVFAATDVTSSAAFVLASVAARSQNSALSRMRRATVPHFIPATIIELERVLRRSFKGMRVTVHPTGLLGWYATLHGKPDQIRALQPQLDVVIGRLQAEFYLVPDPSYAWFGDGAAARFGLTAIEELLGYTTMRRPSDPHVMS